MLSVGQQSLLGYLPAIIIKNILDGKIDISGKLPQYYTMQTVSLFADISGFTKLSEAFSKKGRIGPEFLAFSLNRYMEQLINIIGKNGGDIFKFAGDAILVIWPENKNLRESCRRAIQCAMDIQSKLNNVEITPNKKLSVKVGIGVGECTILVVGGQFKRCEYLSVGEALRQACESETKATNGGQTICSEDVKKYVESYFEMEETKGADNHGHGHGTSGEHEMKYYTILKATGDRAKTKADAYLMRTLFNQDCIREKFPILKTFVPAAIASYLEIEKETWSKEIRMLTTMFLNLKVDLSQTKNEEGMKRIQAIVKAVQRSIYRTRGALNKFLMDDKGSVMLICWGLPPQSNTDDHVRSVESAITLAGELKKYSCGAYMGITTGTCFTGVCGTLGNRREYSLLGEVVNLSARYMGKAIKHAMYNNLEYQLFIDAKTKDLIQNKVRCNYICSDELKGFVGQWHFYEPVDDYKFTPSMTDPFPYIRTHRCNSLSVTLPPDDISDRAVMFNKSLYILARAKEINTCVRLLNNVLFKNKKEIIVIRGVTGSGKSLFIRKVLFEFLGNHPEIKEKVCNSLNGFDFLNDTKNDINKYNNKDSNKNDTISDTENYPPIIFTSFQSPVTGNSPFNAFSKHFKEIYLILKNSLPDIGKLNLTKIKNRKEEFLCDTIGKILFKKESINYVKFIEEILEYDLSLHYQINSSNIKNKIVEPIKRFDVFFENRKYDDKTEKGVINFFKKLIKMYKKFLSKIYTNVMNNTSVNLPQGSNNLKNSSKSYSHMTSITSTFTKQIPLILIAEDSQYFDDISINFLRKLRYASKTKKLNSLAVIISYSDPLYPILKNPQDKIVKAGDLLCNHPEDNIHTIIMDTIMDLGDVQELIRNHLSEKILEVYKTTIDRIDPVILKIIVAKSFKGVPLFILDLVDNLINSKKFVQVLSGELIITSELMDMEEMRDWSNFTVPMRMEKIIGTVIDSLSFKETIILKYASVFGNIFDIQKIQQVNPFNNIANEELEIMIKNLARQGVLEILYDLNPKQLVVKFAIPFLREILYQRMLIEQKYDIHLYMARSLQSTKFKYLPQSMEGKILESHIKSTEKTLINIMEEEDDEEVNVAVFKNKETELNLNNLKIYLVKEICDRLKFIDLKIEEEDEMSNDNDENYFNNNGNLDNINNNYKHYNPSKRQKNINLHFVIKSGYIEKKSDQKFTWEYRYVVITNTKVFYFYHEKEYLENKMPLGTFLLKNLFSVEILNDYQVGNKTNIFSMQVSSWFKKDLIKPTRKFYYSCKTREELFQWVITLNFLRVKATYDEFSSQFGLINLPLKHEIKKAKKKYKIKFKGAAVKNNFNNVNNSSTDSNYMSHSKNMNFYNSIARKSVMKNIKGQSTVRNAYASLVARGSMLPLNLEQDFIDENVEKLNKVKNLVNHLLLRSLLLITGYMQNIIFNYENVPGGIKLIPLPTFLKDLFVFNEESELSSEYNDNENNSENNVNNNFLSMSQSMISQGEKESLLFSASDAPTLKIVKLEENLNNKIIIKNNYNNNSRDKDQVTFSDNNFLNNLQNKKEDEYSSKGKNKLNKKNNLNNSDSYNNEDDDFLELTENDERNKNSINSYKSINFITNNEGRGSFQKTNSNSQNNNYNNDNRNTINPTISNNQNKKNNKNNNKLPTDDSDPFRHTHEKDNLINHNNNVVFTLDNSNNNGISMLHEKLENGNSANNVNFNIEKEISISSGKDNNFTNNNINSVNININNININNQIGVSEFVTDFISNNSQNSNMVNFKKIPTNKSFTSKFSGSGKIIARNKYQNIHSNSNEVNELVTNPDDNYIPTPMLNKLKNLNVSQGENEEEDYINYLKYFKNDPDFKKITNNLINNNANNINNNNNIYDENATSKRERKTSLVARYTDPKYEFLKNENSDNIYKNVHSSNLFKNLLNK